MAKKKNENDGSFTQDKVQKALAIAHNRGDAMVTRVYDTHSAGRLLPKVPGDFIGAYMGIPLLIECKSSRKYTHFNVAACRALTKAHQIASARMWEMARGTSLFIFYSYELDQITAFTGQDTTVMFQHKQLKDPVWSVDGSDPGNINSALFNYTVSLFIGEKRI